MRGNDKKRQTEQIQDWEFALSMDRDDRIKSPSPLVPTLKVSLFEQVKERQPAEAWKLGYWAGWPEMRA